MISLCHEPILLTQDPLSENFFFEFQRQTLVGIMNEDRNDDMYFIIYLRFFNKIPLIFTF